MKEILKDIIKYTHGIGEFDAFKVIVDNTGKSSVRAVSKAMDVILSASITEPIAEFTIPDQETPNSIGFISIDVLSGYLRSPFFDNDNSKIEVNTRKDGVVTDLIFTSPEGHRCTYRTLDPAVAKAKIKTYKSVVNDNEITFTFKPTEQFLRDFSGIASILGGFASSFNFKVQSGVLMLEIGGEDNTATIPVTPCDAVISSNNRFPIKQMLTIMKKAPSLDDVMINIYDERGSIEILIKTEHAVYTFSLNAN
jgi:hypothetical protein